MTTVEDHEELRGSRFTRLAWWSLLGFVPSLVLAFVIGEGLIAALGYPVGGDVRAPWWAALTAVVPALVVFALPAILAVRYGRRAAELGDGRGRLPMWLAVAGATGFVLLNGLSGLLILLD